jgi:hypothetical protein
MQINSFISDAKRQHTQYMQKFIQQSQQASNSSKRQRELDGEEMMQVDETYAGNKKKALKLDVGTRVEIVKSKEYGGERWVKVRTSDGTEGYLPFKQLGQVPIDVDQDEDSDTSGLDSEEEDQAILSSLTDSDSAGKGRNMFPRAHGNSCVSCPSKGMGCQSCKISFCQALASIRTRLQLIMTAKSTHWYRSAQMVLQSLWM